MIFINPKVRAQVPSLEKVQNYEIDLQPGSAESRYSFPLKMRSNSRFGLSWLSSQNITPPR